MHIQVSLSTCELLMTVPCDALSEDKAAFNNKSNSTVWVKNTTIGVLLSNVANCYSAYSGASTVTFSNEISTKQI